MGQWPVLLMSRVKSRDPREGGGRLGRLGEIFVAFEADGNADFRFSMRRIGRRSRRGPDYAQNMAPAAHGHGLAQSDFRGHAQREFDFGAFGEGGVGEEEDSTGAEILSESHSVHGRAELAESEGEQVREPLTDTAFNAK